MKKELLFCLAFSLIVMVLSPIASAEKIKDQKFYFFHGLAEKNDFPGAITFYVEQLPKAQAIRKSKLWQEADQEMKRLGKVCPEPQSDNDPKAFMLWKDKLTKESQKLNQILEKFYAIKGKLQKITVFGDEVSRLTAFKAVYGMVIRSATMQKELVAIDSDGKSKIEHCNFSRFYIDKSDN